MSFLQISQKLHTLKEAAYNAGIIQTENDKTQILCHKSAKQTALRKFALSITSKKRLNNLTKWTHLTSACRAGPPETSASRARKVGRAEVIRPYVSKRKIGKGSDSLVCVV